MANPYTSSLRKRSTPDLDFLIEDVTIPFLSFEYPDHLKQSRSFHLWVMNILPDEKTECWLWMGYTDKDGYGKFSCTDNGSKTDWRAHRYGYQALRDDLDESLVIDHLCRQRNCVNPWHLEQVSQTINYQRGNGNNGVAAKINKEKTHCPRGHPYEGWNVIVLNSGSRACRKCIYRRTRAYALKKKLEREESTQHG